jgi:TolB-like protein
LADIFISYAREDREEIDRLAAQLQTAGLSCWWDKQIDVGARYLERTQAELDAAKAVLVLWSKHSLGSHWVADEAEVGRDTGRIVPISLDGVLPPLGFRQFQTLDFTSWRTGDAAPFRQLVATISKLALPKPVDVDQPTPAGKTAPWWSGLTRAQKNLGTVILVALVAFAAAFALWPRSGPVVRLEPTIAVLPFANLSGDPEKDYFARAISMEIIDKLAQLDGMEVISRNSSFTFKADTDARDVGKSLKVAHVLSGTVRQEGKNVRITADLVDAQSGKTVWSGSYTPEFETEKVYAAQASIAEKVAGAMSIAFDVDARARLAGVGTKSLSAYDYYLRALDEWRFQGRNSLSAELFARAIAIDPAYAEAWAGRAIASGSSSWELATPAVARIQQDASFAMAKRAVELDPNLSMAQSIYSALLTTQLKWNDAELAIHRSLELARDEVALNQRLFLLVRTGRINAAAGVMLELQEVDPLHGTGMATPPILSALGRHDELRKLRPAAGPESRDLSQREEILMGQINAGGPASAIRESLEVIAEQSERAPSEFAKALLLVFDDKPKARAVLHSWYEDKGFQHFSKWDLIPFLAAWYRDDELVLRVWRDELPTDMLRTLYIWGPAFSSARARPEFKALVRDLGLVDYWRAYGWADKCRPVDDLDFECG